MIYSTNGKQISCPQIKRILNKIFGKNISTSMLRPIYLINVHKNMPKINQMQDLATEMGHSVSTALDRLSDNAYRIFLRDPLVSKEYNIRRSSTVTYHHKVTNPRLHQSQIV